MRAGTPAAMEAEVPGGGREPDPVVAAARPGTWLLTPLAIALILVETTDLILGILTAGVLISLWSSRGGILPDRKAPTSAV
jgi:hypothetical protein